MLGSAIFEAAIGLVTVYLLVSLLLVVVNEWISRVASRRSEMLKAEITLMLGGELATAFNEHPLIVGMMDGTQYPSYLPASTVALVLLAVGYDYKPGEKGAPGRTFVKEKWTCRQQQLLEGLRMDATSLAPLQMRIEKWFDLSMEHLSGKFKRITQFWTMCIALMIVLGANIDTLSIVSYLYEGALKHTPTHFKLFWPDDFGLLKVAGLVLSWSSLTLGAPFWFDLLNKLVNLRQTGLPPDENKRAVSAPGMVAH
jgi:hypothetical protein